MRMRLFAVIIAASAAYVGVANAQVRTATTEVPQMADFLGTWQGLIVDAPYDERRRVMIVQMSGGSLSCIWDVPAAHKAAAKECVVLGDTLTLVTVVYSTVTLRISADHRVMEGTFVAKNSTRKYHVKLTRS